MRTVVRIVISTTLAALLLAAAVIVTPDTGNAIPAFARKYRMSCTTCHAPIPRLKAYGNDFAGNGFVLKDQDAPRWFMETGDDNLSLIRDFPLAVRLEGFVKHETETNREFDLTSPYNIKLLSGGSIAPDIAYYFYFFFSERGEVAGVEDAYIMFNNTLNDELDIYVGQFQVSDPLFKRELRLTYEDYQLYRFEVGNSIVDLAYDRGIMLTYGFPTGTDVVVEVINGNGIGQADEFRVFDDDKYKNVAARVSQDVSEGVRIGGFGYYGKEGNDITNELFYVGPDASLSYRDIFELNLQWLYRQDDNPTFMGTPPCKIETNGYMAEAIVMPDGERGRWYVAGLWNYVDSDIDEHVATLFDGSPIGPHKYHTITGHIGYVLRTNIRLFVENTYDIEYEENRALVGFVSAF